MALSPPSLISTKPKPRERPVSRSVVTWALVTVPCSPNSSIRSSARGLERQVPDVDVLAHGLPSGLAAPFSGTRTATRQPDAEEGHGGPSLADSQA